MRRPYIPYHFGAVWRWDGMGEELIFMPPSLFWIYRMDGKYLL